MGLLDIIFQHNHIKKSADKNAYKSMTKEQLEYEQIENLEYFKLLQKQNEQMNREIQEWRDTNKR